MELTEDGHDGKEYTLTGPEALDHTFGTCQDQSGTGTFTLKDLMGHSIVVTTQRYTHTLT